MERIAKLWVVVLVVILTGGIVDFIVLSHLPPSGYPAEPKNASEVPSWSEMHIIRGVVDNLGTGLAQGRAEEEMLQILQERRRDGLNPQACLSCHREGPWLYSTSGDSLSLVRMRVLPGPWLYNKTNYTEGWEFRFKYETSAEEEELPEWKGSGEGYRSSR